MSGTISIRWFFPDWISDAGIRSSSLAARGLWMDLLAIAGGNTGKDHGFVLIAGRVPSTADLARFVGALESEVEILIEELEKNGVFSRDRRRAIYCRRMVREEKDRALIRSRSISQSNRARVFEKCGFVCSYCDQKEGPFEIDHVHPVARGGNDSFSNLTVACRNCNRSKGARLLEEWLQ